MKRSLWTLLALGALCASHAAHAADPAKPAKAAKPAKNPVVLIKTSLGTIKAEIFQDKAPLTAENFLKYADDKFYDGTIFHRVIKGFMIQGGGFDKAMKQKSTRGPVKNEAENRLSNEVGTLAMARTNDPDSATSQFFINLVHNERLDYRGPGPGAGYCVFGKVLQGMEVVNKIAEVRTGMSSGMGDVPTETVTIESVRRAK